jgi:macrolide-specific efflux system membrane fusion protein
MRKDPEGNVRVMVYQPESAQMEPRKITVGLNNNVQAEITDGLAEGDLVVSGAATAKPPTGGQGGGFGGRPGGGLLGGPGGGGGPRP